jgi:hypothetical protein
MFHRELLGIRPNLGCSNLHNPATSSPVAQTTSGNKLYDASLLAKPVTEPGPRKLSQPYNIFADADFTRDIVCFLNRQGLAQHNDLVSLLSSCANDSRSRTHSTAEMLRRAALVSLEDKNAPIDETSIAKETQRLITALRRLKNQVISKGDLNTYPSFANLSLYAHSKTPKTQLALISKLLENKSKLKTAGMNLREELTMYLKCRKELLERVIDSNGNLGSVNRDLIKQLKLDSFEKLRDGPLREFSRFIASIDNVARIGPNETLYSRHGIDARMVTKIRKDIAAACQESVNQGSNNGQSSIFSMNKAA